jgi:sugar lactone lactonase YvrE
MLFREREPRRSAAIVATLLLAVSCTVWDGKTLPKDGGAPDEGGSVVPGGDGGVVVPLASHGFRYLALDNDSVYFTSTDEEAVFRVAKAGGNPTTLVANQTEPGAIAVRDGTVFWVNDASPFAVASCPTTGCSPASTLTTTEAYPYGLVVDAQNVYWVVSAENGGLETVARTGGAKQTLAPNQGYSQWVAIDDDAVYFANSGGGTVMRYGKATQTLTTLASDESEAHGIAIDANDVYFTRSGPGLVKKVAKSGVGGASVVVSGESLPEAITTDGANLYWTNVGDGTIRRCPIGGSSATTLAPGQDKPFGIAVDETDVYWVNSGNGRVSKTKK